MNNKYKNNPSEGVSNQTSETNNNSNLESINKMTRQQRRKMEREGIRTISFQQLKEVSDSNYGRFNRNVNCQMLEEDIPSIQSEPIRIQKIMEHHHYLGEPVETHIRCGITIPGLSNTLFQDVSIEQWNQIGRN